MRVYYNEWDRQAAAWLRELIRQGHLPEGDVDERSIADVDPVDLAGYGQCHFFAGIGGWPLAMQLAGWPADRPLWTGSCPCQPFSVAGSGGGHEDARHLWPAFFRLIAEWRPATVAGEQVASRLGRAWLAAVRADLEGVGYAVGAADLCAAGIGSPHIRQRVYWVADAAHDGIGTFNREPSAGIKREGKVGGYRLSGGLGHADNPSGERLGRGGGEILSHEEAEGPGVRRMAGAWDDIQWLPCRDGKARPTQPGLFPLAHGVFGRVGLLRGYGNAIVPQVAATFLDAFLDAESDLLT